MNLVEVDRALRKLRLSGMADVLEARLRQAQAEKLRQSADAGKDKISVWWHDLQRTWNQHLATAGERLGLARARCLERLEPMVARAYEAIAGGAGGSGNR